MPAKARTTCRRLGCPGTRGPDGCNVCGAGKRTDKESDRKAPWRAKEKRWRGTVRWARLRARQLAQEPLCLECKSEGVDTVAEDADHVEPARGDPRLFWDAANLQSLCHSCHSRKTAKESK